VPGSGRGTQFDTILLPQVEAAAAAAATVVVVAATQPTQMLPQIEDRRQFCSSSFLLYCIFKLLICYCCRCCRCCCCCWCCCCCCLLPCPFSLFICSFISTYLCLFHRNA